MLRYYVRIVAFIFCVFPGLAMAGQPQASIDTGHAQDGLRRKLAMLVASHPDRVVKEDFDTWIVNEEVFLNFDELPSSIMGAQVASVFTTEVEGYGELMPVLNVSPKLLNSNDDTTKFLALTDAHTILWLYFMGQIPAEELMFYDPEGQPLSTEQVYRMFEAEVASVDAQCETAEMLAMSLPICDHIGDRAEFRRQVALVMTASGRLQPFQDLLLRQAAHPVNAWCGSFFPNVLLTPP